MTRYATTTTVPIERTRSEIETTLKRYGATAFGYGWDDKVSASVMTFRIADRYIRLIVPQPSRTDRAITHDGRGYLRTDKQQASAFAQAERTRWRATLLVIKAKLEAVESGIETLEQAFLTHIVLADGSTVGEHALPAIAESYRTGQMPELLPGLNLRALPEGGYDA